MLLRRVIEQVREQNWTAIAIDFVIVVIGVFMGIQVANWNEARGLRQKSADFTAQLKTDLRAEGWRYQMLLEYYRDVRTAAQATADALDGKLALSNEVLLVNAYRATQYKQGAERRSTYDELVSTGNIGLITDRDFRQLVVRAYSINAIDNIVRDGVASRFRAWFRTNIPTDVQHALSSQCGDRVVAVGDFGGLDAMIDYPCRTGLSVEAIDAAVESLHAEPRVLGWLRLRIADIDTGLNDMSQNYRDVYEFLLDVAREQP